MAKKKYKVWEKFMETKEQKIEKLQKRYIGLSWLVYGAYSDIHTDEVIDDYKQEMEFIEQELKELEDDLRRE